MTLHESRPAPAQERRTKSGATGLVARRRRVAPLLGRDSRYRRKVLTDHASITHRSEPGKPSHHRLAPPVGIERAPGNSTTGGDISTRGPLCRKDADTQVCRSSRYEEPMVRTYLNGSSRKCMEMGKCRHGPTDRCTISTMKHVYADSCRADRHSEGLTGLLTSRGRAMAQILKAQSFNVVATDPQEVPSTA